MDKNFFILGEAGTGKDTVAMLMRLHGYFTLALADPIREEYVKFFGTHDHKKNRSKMIEIGESYKSVYGQDVWCKEAIKKIQAIHHHVNGFVITDGRYQHEYDFFVRENGFKAIRIVAPMETRYQRLLERDGSVQQSALEFESKHFIYDCEDAIVLSNDGTVEQLTEKLRGIIL